MMMLDWIWCLDSVLTWFDYGGLGFVLVFERRIFLGSLEEREMETEIDMIMSGSEWLWKVNEGVNEG